MQVVLIRFVHQDAILLRIENLTHNVRVKNWTIHFTKISHSNSNNMSTNHRLHIRTWTLHRKLQLFYKCRICKILHLPEFPMLLNLLADAYLMFHINVTEIDHTVLSLIYPVMNFSSSSVTTGINNCQPLVYTFIPSFIPNMILLNGSIYKYYIE